MVGAATVLLGAGCGCLVSTVNPFAVGAAVDALTGVGIEVNQSIIIGLGTVLWIVTTCMSIFFVMNYAKKVKADKESTILSMQELKDAEEAHGKAASEVHKEVKLTGRQKGVLIAFAFTFVVMTSALFRWPTSTRASPTSLTLALSTIADGNTVVQGWSAPITGLPLASGTSTRLPPGSSSWPSRSVSSVACLRSRSSNTFITGAADMMSVVLVIAPRSWYLRSHG